ncbi:BREX-1 system adenine-specific DNA-methyltransferase PglX [Spirosoma validum]|uniref:site-specific DNA-methyltransferase (adenine-specific) n=1 Tax=Spirosoma validum TaxID=2771355 RepID=A0A927GGZ1_9BACT|nr:BREX-1 system adenine-specific DNA-methyltransferase PglX [Spirosoma validum]MBD2757120.1 BREX-1 system adenine-specific DNA-methyltransferase PglX [Spirosoma validum]
MNTNSLKKFATAARRKLITQITAKLDYVLKADSAALRERADALRQLRDELTRSTRNELIERVAYTWFNRFVALRFLDVNDYQPSAIRAVSPVDGFTTPQLLDEAKQGQIPDELAVDARRVLDLLDGRLPSRDPQNEAYGLLLLATCNALNVPLPFLFEPLADYTELLMPDDLLSPQSVLTDIRDGMTADDCQNVEIIGWLYQFYISERKDTVFAAKSKVKAEDIPAATQLFTPRWVVEYMVQNTLGKLWLRNKPSSGLKALMPYYLESPSETTDIYLKLTSPQELTLLDPAAGSGHILVYAFELLVHIYEEEGYGRTDIPSLILQHNLMGFDIDERAAQLASFALAMKARQYDRRFFRRNVQPRVVALHKLQHTNPADWQPVLADASVTLTDTLRADLTLMTHANNLGALIRPETGETTLQQAANLAKAYADQSSDLFRKPQAEDLAEALAHLALLARKHTCVVANPPYMGGAKMNDFVGKFMGKYYPDSKADLMTGFMERTETLVQPDGYVGMINLPSWMFLSSFEAFRKNLIQRFKIDSLLQMGRGIFGSDFGSVAFTLQFSKPPHGDGVYRRLFEEHVQVRSIEKIRDLFLDKTYGCYHTKQDNFEKIPGEVIGYWLSEQAIGAFVGSKLLNEIGDPRQGMATCDNDRFTRMWYEVTQKKIGWSFTNGNEAKASNKKWIPYNKGGAYRKWYGNQDLVVNWENDGGEITEYVTKMYGSPSKRIASRSEYFKESLSWSKVTSGSFAVRYFPKGFIFDVAGCSIFFKDQEDIGLVAGVLNSTVGNFYLGLLSPTLNFEAGTIAKFPLIGVQDASVNQTINSCISISSQDWDARETSWDFQTNELLRHRTDNLLANAVATYETYWQAKFSQLHEDEEALNRIFIDLYGLQDELAPDVAPDNITILQQEAKPDATGKLQFDRRELMAQFVSYAVGCIFGRYSLSKPGLVLASQGQTLADYQREVEAGEIVADENAFQPDADNIIPILDEDWFADDIVSRFRAFLRASFGEESFNQNLMFVEECLGMDLRKYFVRYFYDDHIRRYRRRPIYWLFRSPKGSFSALIYLHRYTPDTVARLLNGYLREYQDKLRNQREQQQTLSQSALATAGEKTRAQKEIDRLDKVLGELAQYEREVIYPLATDPIAMDLDDGVLVNYNRFSTALAPVKGLTGKAGASGDDE